MVMIQMETSSTNSHPRFKPSWVQEWNNIQFLSRLNRQFQSLRKDEVEFFDSDLAAITEVTDTGTYDDLSKVSLLFIEIAPTISTENETRIYNIPKEEMSQFQESMNRSLIVPSTSGKVEDLLDWDAHIETPPPPKHSVPIKVRFKYIGRSKPIPIEDPWA